MMKPAGPQSSQLIQALRKAADTLGDVLNAELAAGNDEQDDVQEVRDALDEIEAVLLAAS
jgi:hypothetical protein